MQSLAEVVGSQAGIDATHGVGTGGPTTQPLLPKPRAAVLLQRVQAAQAGPEHHPSGFQENGHGDARFASRILDRGDDLRRQTVPGLALLNQTSENGGIPFDPAVVATRPRTVLPAIAGFPDNPERSGGCALPLPWARTLGGLATPALHQVQRAVQFPVGTATIRFATAAPTHRQRAAQKGLAGNDLRQPRTAAPLAGRQTRSGPRGVLHLI